MSQDAPVTKVWRKSVNRYRRYRGNIKIWDVLGHAVTLTFDLLTPKSNQFFSIPRRTSDKSLAKNRYWRYRGNIKLPRESRTDARTHGQRHGRMTQKHIASAGAYRRRRLTNCQYVQWEASEPANVPSARMPLGYVIRPLFFSLPISNEDRQLEHEIILNQSLIC